MSMDERELDALLARVREETPADAGAAERFLAWHRAEQGMTAPLAARARATFWPTLLACAAVLAGVLMLRPAPALPASAAYDAYQGALGEGW
ncbi:hypothetical protein [Deinococcus geothermalis]|uniref:Uncharacterized protein n=1 Tax=Deinococcus geothermalis (strain DSM 11300 / CIP 105573 / AG-3a) TaxID=319795 RepID=Q1IW20_DEIGD|nr:hypothetical protein [Deinococcus geothermalis]ABF46564.1 hypothetical protein Dgeo_2270 [Deinococcus geothermalis DSM 11300]